jgi:thiopeptide-type bacteriocin biosynthesis protein
MKDPLPPSPWDARHIFYAQPSHADRLIAAMADVMRSSAPDSTDWFFIRYVEGGVHLRWRIHDRLAHIRETAFGHIEAVNAALRKEDGVSGAVTRAMFADPSGRIFQPGSVAAIPYEREWDRYGGPAAIEEHERLFGISTLLTIKIVADTPADQSKRARHAIPLMVAALAAMGSQTAPPADFFSSYSAFWRQNWTPRIGTSRSDAKGRGPDLMPLFTQYRAIAEGHAAPIDDAGRWAAALAHAVGEFRNLYAAGQLHHPAGTGPVTSAVGFAEALDQFCHSQIHMMNNRLGLAPSAEITMSDIIVAGLSR